MCEFSALAKRENLRDMFVNSVSFLVVVLVMLKVFYAKMTTA